MASTLKMPPKYGDEARSEQPPLATVCVVTSGLVRTETGLTCRRRVRGRVLEDDVDVAQVPAVERGLEVDVRLDLTAELERLDAAKRLTEVQQRRVVGVRQCRRAAGRSQDPRNQP